MSSDEPDSPLADVWEPDAGPDAGTDECNFAVADKAPFTTQSDYWRDYARVCKIVASHPQGTFLNHIVGQLYGSDTVESGSTEYQRIRRFLNRNPEFFRVRKSNGLIRAEPTLELFDLINGGIIQNPGETPSNGDSDFCAQLLKSVKEVNEKGERLLEYNLREYVERINDLRLILRSEQAEPEYISMPYKTRFNDQGRISKQWSIMSSCIEKAGEKFSNAALLTLTTDPKKFDSIYDMVDNINKSWNRLMSWLSTDSRLGYRPEYVKVLEFTEKGYPHLHAIVFLEDESTRYDGMPWLTDKHELSAYWGKYQGEVVDIQPLTHVEDLPDEYDQQAGWVRWDSDGNHGGDLGDDVINDDPDDESALEAKSRRGGQTAGEYLGKYLSAVYGGIKSVNGEDLDADTEKYEDKAATWKIAMYWATGRKIRTESRELRQAVEDDMEDEDDEKGELAEIVRECEYEFVGAYSYDQIPQHIRRELAAIDALMQAVETEDHSGKVVGSIPDRIRHTSLADRLEGSGLLNGLRRERTESEPSESDVSDGGSEGVSAADFM